MGCPDAVLAAIGERFQLPDIRKTSPPSTLSPLVICMRKRHRSSGATGLTGKSDRWLYPSGPSSMTPPLIWQMINDTRSPPGICLPGSYLICTGKRGSSSWRADTNRHGYLCGSPVQGGAMNEKAAQQSLVERVRLLTTTGCFSPVSCRRWRSFAYHCR